MNCTRLSTRFWAVVLVGGLLAVGCGRAASVPSAARADEPAAVKAAVKAGAKAATQGKTTSGEGKMEKACFAAGCFWGVEAAFRKVPGVVDVAVGYTGGKKENPTYKEVCTDRTGHAEAVLVDFDAEKVSYEKLLEVFFGIHDPTTLNRQGPDVGSQYRSAIFYFSPEQQAAAEAAKARLQKKAPLRRPIVTQIEPAARFWRAEEYHQRYFEKRGGGSCHVPAK